MNIINFRKYIFLNSQYCNYYQEPDGTVLAGIMRSFGYKYSQKLSQEDLNNVSKVYRNFTTVMNTAVALEIVAYVYLFVFPYFVKLLELPYWNAILIMAVIPLVFLYLTYIIVNYFYERYLKKNIGIFKRVKFIPTIKNVEEHAFDEYKKTSRKSVFVMAAMLLVFGFYVLMPFLIKASVSAGKYNAAVTISNIYLRFIPINPEIYVQRAYANFKLKHYKQAVSDYEKANEYTHSDSYNYDILGVKTYLLPKEQMLTEFDKAIALEEEKPARYFLISEKANYLLKNKEYKKALDLYNNLLKVYENKENVFFAPESVYYYRGFVRLKLGDSAGMDDIVISRKKCEDCQYDAETTLVTIP